MTRRFYAALLAACLLTVPAHATPVSKDVANTYYNNCMAQSDPRLSEESHKSLCACTAAKMTEALSIEEMQAMKGNKEIQNKVLVEVYAPCMGGPVRDMVGAECRSNPQVSGAKATTVCECVGKLTGDWYELSGRTLMAEALKRDPSITDPTKGIQDSPQFQQETMKNLQSCMQNPG